MQITKSKLKKIIQEETRAVLQEDRFGPQAGPAVKRMQAREQRLLDQIRPEDRPALEQQAALQGISLLDFVRREAATAARQAEIDRLNAIEKEKSREEGLLPRYPRFFAPTGEETEAPDPFAAEQSLVGGGIEGTRSAIFPEYTGDRQSEEYPSYAALAAVLDYERHQEGLPPLAKFDPNAPYTPDPREQTPVNPRYLGQTPIVGFGITGKEDYQE